MAEENLCLRTFIGGMKARGGGKQELAVVHKWNGKPITEENPSAWSFIRKMNNSPQL
ncbi:hypothetical protein [Heyndrickxia acidiproducens]|uniref:hypothetical protein n=1 Tax=Heyndrickxia acidiproducens TaxID=1121084 RepID=UPI00035CBB62|nr:hypothetical protein [Heyndrickxia acidiproducens]